MSDDIISRQAAIDALAKHEKSRGHNYSMFVDVVSECAEIIRDVPPMQPEQQWTSCSEGPPKEESEVLVTTSWNDVCKAWYSNGKWRAEFTNEYDDNEILAWMPLPKPYRKDDD